MPGIRISNGPSQGFEAEIGLAPILVGRETDCDVQLLDKGASRRHAEIFRVGEMCFIRDLGSRNGTFLNDERVTEELLRSDDRIVIGGTTLIFDSKSEHSNRNGISFTESSDDELSNTLELRLEDIATLDEDTDHNVRNLRALYQLGKLLGSLKSVDSAREESLSFLAQYIPAAQIYLFARDTTTGTFTPRARFERNPNMNAQVSRTIIKKCLKEARSILTHDAMLDDRFRANESVVMQKIKSVMCVPMVRQGDMSGVLYLSASGGDEVFVEDDLELVTAAATLIGLALENLENAKTQNETLFSAMRAVVGLMESTSPNLKGHSERVADFSYKIATQLSLSPTIKMHARLAGLLHDIGKVSVPKDAFEKGQSGMLPIGHPGTQHVIFGADLAARIADAKHVAPAIKHHHEAFDGSGYPEKLSGEAIPFLARIVATADQLDHIFYEDGDIAAHLDEAIAILTERSGRELDPEIVRAASSAFKRGTGSFKKPLDLPMAHDQTIRKEKGV